jgi:hypothetical protein
MIEFLQGVSMRSILFYSIVELLGTADAPNLYWALSELPSAYDAYRKSAEVTGKMWLVLYPELQNPEEEFRTIQDWHEVLEKHLRMGGIEYHWWPSFCTLIGLGLPAIQHAKQQGMPEEEIRSTCLVELIGRYVKNTVRSEIEPMVAALSLPFPQALPVLERFEARCEHFDFRNPVATFVRMLTPSVNRGAEAAAQSDQRVAALMCVEAIRMHVAETGALPEKLEDVTIVPLPEDPMAGEPFEYRLEAGFAVLRQAKRNENFPPPERGTCFRIRLREE